MDTQRTGPHVPDCSAAICLIYYEFVTIFLGSFYAVIDIALVYELMRLALMKTLGHSQSSHKSRKLQ